MRATYHDIAQAAPTVWGMLEGADHVGANPLQGAAALMGAAPCLAASVASGTTGRRSGVRQMPNRSPPLASKRRARRRRSQTSMPDSLPGHPVARFVCKYMPAINSLRRYSFTSLRADFVAGLSVAAVAVPQAMAYAIAAGVPATYGLYTAIVMTAVGALFASSKQLINGPTNVISIAVLSALAPVAADQKLAGAITLALLVGGFQTLITVLRLGDLTRYISHSVVVGFTTGASLLLVIDQTRNLFGWTTHGSSHEHFLVRTWHTWTAGGAPHLATSLIGFGAIAMVVTLRVLKKRIGWPLFPELLFTVIAAAVLVAWLRLDRQGVKVVGAIPGKLPAFTWPNTSLDQVRTLSESAMAIATLGLLEALAMAKHIASQTGQKFDLNQQCLSEGLANLSGAFFQCIPGSGSLTRSAINHQAGAATQWSGVWSAVAVALITLLFAPYARFIPSAALAGILMVTAMGMVDWRALPFHLRATQFDAFIVLTTAIAAIGISVEFCILIGILASFLLAVPRAGRMTRTEFVVNAKGVVRERLEEEPIDDRLLLFGLEGELFFGSSMALDEHLSWFERRAASTGAKVLVLRVKRLRNPDAVGMRDIDQFIRRMRNEGTRVILAGVRADLLAGLRAAGALHDLEPDQVFSERKARGSSTIDAIAAAYAYLDVHHSDRPKPANAPLSLAHFEV
jgi:sulfate permease, SulP family